ncbi:carboxylesterase 2/para-nitrobenzyl esterase [Nitrosospira multiformis ATCC 25196]|uniref:Carboxylesterase 2/para-nitrobenzyl esterase n=1 Tax=Nitrosospira multiformis (strain ATCC 25196 / NCIMB 11849 / C 71) TaxID=323848 RepID=A0A1H5WEF4_NITMU|nr:carboxylesterase family protein [Nitrosospira multiformis]SEF97561.1 carboxylesterase 2/para-nitrobenzyl esterase [Nitrosospira multiformis ATCC 25196]
MHPVVETLHGKPGSHLRDGAATFKGVPYAASPFGPNHTLHSLLNLEVAGVMLSHLGRSHLRVSYPTGIAECLAQLVGASGDCLTLNIWTPALAPAGLWWCGFAAGLPE